MVLFECPCGNKENTALAMQHYDDPVWKCSECNTGKWHGRFAKHKVKDYNRFDGSLTYIMVDGEQVQITCYFCQNKCEYAFLHINIKEYCSKSETP